MRRTRSRTGALLLVLCMGLVASTTSGCSLLFVDGPPDNAKKLRGFNCTTSNTLPTTDVVIGGLAAIDIVGLLAEGSSTYDSTTMTYKTTPNYAGAAGAAAVAALFATSAAVGYRRTSACKDATADLMTRLYPPGAPPPGFAPSPYAPYPYAPPAQPYDPWNAPAPGAPPGPAPAPAPSRGAGPWGAPPPGGPPPPASGPAAPPAPPPAGGGAP